MGGSIGPLIIGSILDHKSTKDETLIINDYHEVHVFILLVSGVGVIFTIVLYFYDINNKNVLND